MLASNRAPGWSAGAIVTLTVAAPLLAGSTALWAQAAIILTTGLLFLLVPPRRSLGVGLNVVFGLLALLPLIDFVPARFFPTPPWRATLTNLGVQLPSTWSAQPWLSAESACLLWLGLAWAYYLLAYDWDAAPSREKAWDSYCIGILLLAALLVTGFALKWRIPFWPNAPEFGFFPNRNQTSNVLGLGGIIIYANAFENLERGNRRGWLWLGGLALVCWALILNYSRAGIILFFAGALTWHLWWLTRSEPRGDVPRMIAWGPLAILAGLLLLAGGETLVRFKQSTDLLSTSGNGRFLIQRDALELFKVSPLLGVGLGNFRALFSAHRRFFVSESEAIHPESDWLWTAVEMGLLAPLLLVVGVILWVGRCFPFVPGTRRPMRLAAMICGIGFIVHGIFDVSGHRIGALWPAVFLASTAINPEHIRAASAVVPAAFRFCGVAFVAIAIWWFGSVLSSSGPPTTVTVQGLIDRLPAVTAAEQYDQLLGITTKGLRTAPLNWIFHYNHGVAEAYLRGSQSDLTRDFAVARFLMPNWPGLYLKEGLVCLFAGEIELTFDIWKEGLERLPNPAALFSDIYGVIKDDPDLREKWRQLGQRNKVCELIFLQNATPTEFQLELNRMLGDNPELRGFKAAELKTLFRAWYDRGDKLALAETLRSHPNWQQVGWRELARVYADYQDYRPAYDTLMHFVDPQLPEGPPNEPFDSLVTRFRVSGNESDGLLLARAQAAHRQVDDALAIITLLASRPNPSPLVSYVEAQLWAQKQDWSKAWQAMWRYVEQAKR